MIVQNPMTIPTRNPVITCVSVCCLNSILLVPTIPPIMRKMQNQTSGLKLKRMEKASNAPSNPPIAAECVEIFHHTLMTAHTTCINNAATRILAMN